MSPFAIAKEHLLRDLETIIQELLGAGASARHKRRSYWNVISPWRVKAKASQTVIYLTGARRGGWIDFVSGDKGDAIDLVAWVKWGVVTPDTRLQAVAWTQDRFGIQAMSQENRRRMEAEGRARRQAMAAAEAERKKSNRDRARRFFFSCQEELSGTPVETYYASRGIHLADVPNLTPAIRYCSDCEYWLGVPRDSEGRKLGPGPKFPAKITAMVDRNGRLAACHYTFLSPDGNGKASVERPKLMFPDTAGLTIRLTYGPSNLNMERAADAGLSDITGLTEGIEDGLSAAIADPELRMCAAGSLSNFMSVPDHPAVRAWMLFRDNDWGNPQATRQFNRALARFRSFGKPVEDISMPASWGKDVNDALNQGESV